MHEQNATVVNHRRSSQWGQGGYSPTLLKQEGKLEHISAPPLHLCRHQNVHSAIGEFTTGLKVT